MMKPRIDFNQLEPFYDCQNQNIEKWNSFTLSKHMAFILSQQVLPKKVPKKKQMTEQAINDVLASAFNQRKQIVVQLENRNAEGLYAEDTIGFIEGFDELGLMIAKEKIHYDEIRNIQLLSSQTGDANIEKEPDKQ